MEKVLVKSRDSAYCIYIGEGFEYFVKLLEDYGLKRIIVVFDYNAYRYHGKWFMDILNQNGILVDRYILKAKERIKTQKTVYSLYEFLYKLRVDRNSVIVSFGGGIIGDIVGFVASSYKRGIKFIQIPTTLLACVDSSIGGKVAVNFKNIKNLIGAFYNPLFVYSNIKLLSTLDKRQYNCGMVEIIKHALLADEAFFRMIENNEYKGIADLIKRSCEIKASIVEKDEKEEGIRIILNLGHTVGHAIESVSKFKISHGEAVAVGILYSLKVSYNLNKIDKESVERIELLFKRIGVLPKNLSNLNGKKIKKCIEQDKKVRDGVLQYVILNKIGKSEVIKMDELKF